MNKIHGCLPNLPLSKNIELRAIADRAVLGASWGTLLGRGVVIASACSLVGCGFIGQHFSLTRESSSQPQKVSMVQAATERPVFRRVSRTPKQLPAQSARLLPKPDLNVTPEVQRELDRYMTQDRATVRIVLERHAEHKDDLQKAFETEGVPEELLSVAAVESKFSASAVSPMGARGMWQFMRTTAQFYGLTVSGRKDDRLDPQLSTAAAAKHLRDLFLNYNDWHLALAAYNAGMGAVNRIVTRNGETNFWQLVRTGAIPSETSRFVPRVIALSLIVRDPERYGFEDIKAVG